MNLAESTHNEVFCMARTLASIDSKEEQSTWIHDPCMWRENENRYFTIEHQSKIIGFVILRIMNFGKIGLWMSLDPNYRDRNYGAISAHLELCLAFNGYKAKQVVSDVYRNNKRSNKAHKAIFKVEDDARSDMITYVMTRERFEENCQKYKRATDLHQK